MTSVQSKYFLQFSFTPKYFSKAINDQLHLITTISYRTRFSEFSIHIDTFNHTKEERNPTDMC